VALGIGSDDLKLYLDVLGGALSESAVALNWLDSRTIKQ
jgi:hypothetical protein